jgi:hypothetical protein
MGLSGTAAGGMSGFGGSLGGTGQRSTMRTVGTKTINQVRKLQDAPNRLLKETDILAIQDRLSAESRHHVDNFVNL